MLILAAPTFLLPSLGAAQTENVPTGTNVVFSYDAYEMYEREDAQDRVHTIKIKAGPDAIGGVSWKLEPVVAQRGTDYEPVTKEGIIRTGHSTEHEIEIRIIDDDLVEPVEAFKIVLSNPTGSVTFPDGDTELEASVNIIDNDDFSITVDPVTVTEGDSAQFHLKLGRARRATDTATPFVVVSTGRYEQDDIAQAEPDDDYSAIKQSPDAPNFGYVSWAVNEQTKTVTVATTQDEIDEPSEAFTLLLARPNKVDLSDFVIPTATILDNDPAPVISVSSPRVQEGNAGHTAMPFSLTLDRPSAYTVTLNYVVSNASTAKWGEDFKPFAKGVLTFLPNETKKTLNVEVAGDTRIESNETVVLHLSQAGNATFAGSVATLDVNGTIVDDDESPVAVLALTGPPHNVEEGGTAVFRAELDRALTEDVSFEWRTVNGDARSDRGDFTRIFWTEVVIPAGDTGVDLEVETILDQEVGEEKEYFTVLLRLPNLSGVVLKGSQTNQTRATGYILDEPAVSVHDAQIVTEGRTALFPVTLSSVLATDVTVHWKTMDGRAQAGLDYTAVPDGQVTIAAGDQDATIRVKTIQDTIDEDNQEFSVTLTQVDGAAILNVDTATGVIRDDDARPRMTIDDASITEGGTARFRVKLSTASDRPVSVRWQTADDTASAQNKDYVAASLQTVTIPAGDLHADIEVVTLDDKVSEGNERFKVLLSHAPDGMLKDDEAFGTIIDNEPLLVSVSPARLQGATVSLPNGQILEPPLNGSTTLLFDIRLTYAVNVPVTVDVQVLNGDENGNWPATRDRAGQLPRGDYRVAPVEPGQVQFMPGETSKTFTIAVLGDALVEGYEIFRVALDNPSGVSIDPGRRVSTVTIKDDSGMHFFVPAGQPHVVREGGKIRVTLERKPRDISELAKQFSSEDLEATYRVCLYGGIVDSSFDPKAVPGRAVVSGHIRPSDDVLLDDVFLSSAGRGTEGNHCLIRSDAGSASVVWSRFPVDTWQQTFEIQTIQDTRVEGDETVTLLFVNRGNRDVRTPQSGAVRHEITILDDDAHLVRVENASASEGSPAEFKIYVDPPLATGETGTVNYTTADGTARAGADYTAQSLRQITLNAPAQTGAPAATISIPTVEDELSEVTETFTVTLSNPAVGFSLGDAEHRTATATILDNDRLLVSFEDTVVAEGKDAVVTARLSQAVEEDVIVTWKTVADGAESPADFDAVSSQQLTISAGTRAASVTVATKKDSKDEFDEDFKVVATAVSPLYVHVGAAAVVTIRDHDPATLNFDGYANATTEENKPWRSATPTLTGMPFNHVTWTLEGDDAAAFKINADTGILRLPAQNYEKQTDKDKNNVYEVIVRATDEDGTSATSPLTVKVTNVVTHVRIDADHKVEGEDLQFSVKRESSTGVNVPITFKWRTQQDTDGENPADETDYTPVTKWKTVNMGKKSTITLSVSTTDDAVVEPSETMRVELSDLSDGKTDDVLFSDDDGQEGNVAIGVIDDNDQRGVKVRPLRLTLDEADDPLTDEVIENEKTYRVVLTSQPTGTGTVIVNVASRDSTVATVDKSRLTFDADNWETAQMVTVTAQNDAINNTGNERATRITHTVSAADTDYADEVEKPKPVAVRVNDDDKAPMALTVTVDTDTNTGGDQNVISEGADKPTVRVTATLDGTTRFATDKTITITVGDTEKDTATEGTGGDYATVADFDLTLPAGAASVHKDLTLTLTDDSVDEPDETISVAGELSGVTATGTVITIQDNDPTPTATLVLTPASIHESGDDTSSTVTATMDGTSSEAVTLTVSATPVTPAVAGDLALSDTTTLTIPALSQASTGAVTITAVDNDVDAADKTVTVAATVTGGNKLVQAPGNQTLTIKDDDTRGITVTKTTLTLDEADNAATTEAEEHEDTYTVVLDSEPLGGTVTIGVASGDTKIATVAPVSLTFDASDWDVPQTVTVTAVADAVDNPMDRRTVTVTHTVTATGTDYDGATAESVTVTVNDDDGEPTLSINNPSVTEVDSGATATLTFTMRLAPTSGNTVTVVYADAGTGTATSVTDYTALAGGTLTFDPGDTSKTVAITVTGDDIDEPDETVVVRLSSPVNATLTGGETTLDGTGIIEDNDPAPTVSVADATAVPEGDVASPDPPNNMTFTVTLSAASGQAVTVPYTLGGTATASTDYTAPNPRSVTIAAGQTQADVTIPVTGDEVDEANETITVTLGTPTNATVSTAEGAGVATGTITDDDTRGISVTPTELTVAEADNPSTAATREDQATYKVVLTSQPTGAVTVNLKSGDESVARIDTAGLVFNTTNWNMERTVTVTVQPDAIDNTGNMRKVDISHTVSAAGTDYTGETAESVAVTITDDDDAPTGITLTASPDSVTEDGGAKTITVTAAVNGTTRYAEARTVMVSVGGGTAISGTDYAAVDSFDMTVGTGENDATKTFTLTPTNDVLDEPIEIINVTGTLSGTTITGDEITLTDDDDPPSFSITGDAVVEGGKIPFTVTRSGAVDNVVSVKIATAADSGDDVSPADANDYTAIAPAQTVNFGKGVTSQTVEVQTTQDDLFEPDETFRATLSAPALADGDPGTGVSLETGKGTATGTIKNDDTEPSFAVADASAAEGDAIIFTVTRSGAMDNAVSVKWNTKAATGANAALATDYTPVTTATTLTFAKDVGSQTFTVATTEDVLDEENETFLVELTGAVGGKITTAQATGTINDDDAAPTGITLSVDTNGAEDGTPNTVAEDAGATVVTVTATVNGTTRYVDAKTVTVSVADNTAASPADYAAVNNFTITIAAGAASQTGSFTVTPVDDDLDEPDETMDVTGTLTDVTITGATVTLTDTDAPVSFSIADAEATEGGKVTFTVSRKGAGDNVASVKIATAADSGEDVNAADADDYTAIATARTLNFAKGVTSQTVEVQTTQDDLFEPDETFRAVLSAPALAENDPGTGVSIEAGKGTATGTIKNDDGQPSFAVADANAAEGAAITFTVTRSGAMDNAVSVKWHTKPDASDGANAASTDDYTPMPTATKLDFAKGVETQTFTVATTEDTLHEGNETFLVELTEPVGAIIGDAEATGTINDDDAAPTTLTLAVDADNDTENVQSSLAENGGAKTVKVTATLGGSTQFDVATTLTLIVGDDDDSATEDTDYTDVADVTLTIPAGDQAVEHTFTLTPTDDAFHEASETISFDATLTGVTVTGASITLTSEDAAPALTLTVDADKDTDNIQSSLAEDGGVKTVRVTATLDGTTRLEDAADLTLAVGKDGDSAVEGTDYTTVADQTITIRAGVASVIHDFTLTPTQDDLHEGSETISLDGTLTGVTVTDATLTVTDDDAVPSGITLSVSPATVGEEDGETEITVTATVNGTTRYVDAKTVRVSVGGGTAISGTDYDAVSDFDITIAAGDASKTGTFDLTPTQDDLHEGSETISLDGTLTGVTVTDATLTVTDDDSTPVVTLELDPTSIDESGDGNATTVTASLSGASSQAVTLTVAAAAVSPAVTGDFTLSENTTLSIAAGSTTSTGAVTITAVDNKVDAPNKTVTVSAAATGGNGVENPANATLTITDDDERGISVAPVALTLAEVDDPLTENITEHRKTYTVELDSQPTGTVTVNLSSGDTTIATLSDNSLEFTASDWDAQTVTVTAVADAIDNPADKRTVRITHTVSAAATDYKDETAAAVEVTVTDDDGEPTLSIDSPSVAEGDSSTATLTFKVTLSPASGKPVSVTYADAATGTATSATDYRAIASGTLNFAAGDTEETVTVTVNGDTTDEPNETVVLRLSSPSNAALSGGKATLDGTGTITDDDATPTATLVLTPATIDESGNRNESTVTATLSGESSEAVTLTVAAAAVDPAVAGDYTLSTNKTLTIAAGTKASTGAVTITAVDNSVDAPNKSVTVSATANGGSVADPANATLTITDDDTRGVTVTGDPLSMDEADKAGTQDTREDQASYTVVLMSEPTDDVRIDISAPAMVTLSPTSLTFTPSNWNVAQTVTATAVDDTIDNAGDARTGSIAHTVVAGSSDYAGVAAESVAVTVNDDDGEPTLSIDAPSVTEGDSSTATMTFKVTLSPTSGKPVSVTYADATTGTATSATDYRAIAGGTLNFTAGQTEKTVDVTVNGDTIDELDESVILRLSSPSNARLSGGSTTLDGTGTITDDDDAPTVSVADATAVTEGNDPNTTVNLSFTLTLDAVSGRAVTVPYTLGGTASAGADYTEPDPLLVTIAAGSRRASIDIPVKGDTLDELDETVTVTLGNPTNATISTAEGAGTASGTINDDDAAPTVSVADATAVNEGNDPDTTVNMSFTVTLSAASAKAVTVPYTLSGTATGGSDYETPSPTSLSIPAGDASGTIQVKVKGDALDEPNETIIVTLGAPTNATVSAKEGAGTGTGTITDDDGTPSVTLKLSPASIAEDGGAISGRSTVTATLSGPSSQAVTLTVAAAAVSPAVTGDFTLSENTTLSIAAGSTTSTGAVTITAVDNDVDAASKTVTVSATATGGNGVANPDNATLTITDDDTRGIRVTPVTLTLAEVDDPSTQSITEHQKTYSIELDSEPTGTVTVNLASGDTTVATLSDNSLEFTASDWDAQTVSVTAVADAIDNTGNERTVRITHTVSATGTDYEDETAAPVDVTVTDDDDAPDGITLSVDTNEVAEDAGKTSITVTATVGGGTRYSADTTVTVTVGKSTDSAVSGTDYAAVEAFDLVIPAGEASVSKAFDLTPADDALDEADEAISVTGESGSLTVTGTSITLTDDDVPELSIAAGSAVTEGTAAGFTVNADIAPVADLTVNLDVATTDSFAASGTTGSKSFTFRAGRNSETYTVNTQADTTDEPDGSVTVTIEDGTNYAVSSSDGSASVDVNDDDATTVALARAGSGGIAENGGTEDLTITLGRALVAGESVTVPLAVSGATVTTHYTLALKGDGGTGVTLVTADPHGAQNPAVKIEGAEARTATLTLTAVANTDNASRTVSIAYGTSARAPSSSGLSGGITTSGSASVPILDDDAMVSVAAASAAEGSAVVFTVTLPEVAPSGGVTIGYSTSDGRGNDDDDTHQVATSADYTAAAENATFTIAQGQRSGTISISTTQDTTYEGDHYFTLTLNSTDTFNLSDTAGAAVGTITDAADRPTFAFSAASTDADEDDGTLTLTVAKTGTTLVAATVSYATTNGTATGGSDFTAITSTDLDFTASEASKTFTVSLTDDSADEPAEAFTVDLTAGAHAQLGSTKSHSISITDNDATTVQLAAPSTAIDEAGGAKTITVTLGRALTGDETLDVPLTFAGTATFGEDYTLAAPNSTPTGVSYSHLASTDLAEDPPTIAFSGVSGAAASATVILTATADSTDEGASESVTVGLGTLNASSGENLDGGASGSGTATFNITDDDGTPTATLVLTPTSIDESGDGNATTVTATLSGPSSEAVTLTVAAAAVSPAATGDYTFSANTTLTIAAGATESTGTVTITAVDNDVDAANKTVTVSATASGGGVAAPSAVTLTITDDDTRGVTVAGGSLTMDEADNAGTADTREDQGSYTVVLDSEPTDDVRIDLTAPAMVTLSPTSLTFTPSNWDQAQTVTATAVDDAIDNAGDARTGNITHAVVAGSSDYTGVAAASVAVTVNDDDGTPTVTLELSSASVTENGGSSTVTATLTGASSQAVTLTVAAAAVSPAATGDFALSVNTTLTIAAGATESTGAVTVTAVDNDVDAPNKSVTVSATASGGGVAAPSPVTLTITDDDERGISVAPVALTLAEVDDPLTESIAEHRKTYSIELDSEPTGTVTVNLASGDTTVATLSDNSLEFTASDWDAQTVTVTAVPDAIDNAGDARTATITHTVSATGTDYEDETAAAVNVTVTDDDGEPTLSIDAPSVAEGDSSTATMTFKVTLSPASGKPVSVTYADAATGTATSATDYAAISSGTLNFAAGQTEKTVDVTVNGDTTDEPSETVVLRLSSPSNAALSGGATTLDGTGTITDDDDAPTVSVANATAVNEGDDADTTVDMSFTVTLSEASALAVTVPYTLTGTATGGSDYETPSPTSLSIPAGDAGGTIVIKVKGDALDEPNETIIVTLGSPTNATVSTAEGAGTGTGTITDDDGTPSVTLKLASATITENGGSSTVTASLSGASHQAVTLTVAAAAVSPAVAGDFTLSGTTLTIAAGATESTGTVTITAVDNDVDAANKTVTVSATASGGGVAAPSAVTLTITDDDTRGVTVAGGSLTMDEADNAGTADTREDQGSYTVVLDSEPTDDVRIDLTAPAMVTLSPTSLTFTPSNWDQAQTVTATAVDDAIDNAGDARTGSIAHTVVAGSSDYAGVAAASVAVTVTDDDGTPTVTLKLASASITENGGSSTVTASLSGASHQAVTLTVAAAAVSPAVAGDFTLSGTTLTIAAGATESTGTVTITAEDNDVDAANKTVTVSAAASGGGVAAPSPVTLTITDDDERGISVAPVALTLAEVDDPLTESIAEHRKTYSIELDSQPTGTVTVNLASGDTTIATLSDNSLEFTASDWDAQTVTVTAVPDAIDNAGDARTATITHTVSATGTDYEDETAAAVNVTVTDDDGEPTLSIDAPSVAEGDSSTATMTFKVTLSPASGKPVSVTYADAATGTATSATDYAAITGGTLNFAAGQTEKTVDVTVNGDTTDEPSETVILRLSSPSNAALSGGAQTLDGTGTITDDDDAPTVSVANATAVNEGNDADTTADMSFTVSLSEASALAVTVPYTLSGTATGGSDYETPLSTSLLIPAGDTSGTIVIKVKGDTLDEPNETIIVMLGAPTNATVSTAEGAGTGTGTITDDDGTPSVTLELASASITENGGSSTVTASLSGASHQAVTLTVAAAAVDPATSSDFNLSGTTLTIAAGNTTSTGTVTITAVDNDVDAANKTVIVSATASGGGVANPADVTLTITDDDAAKVTLVLTPTRINESGQTNVSTVTATLSSESSAAVTVEISVPNDAPVTLSTNKTLTIAAGAMASTGTVTITAVDNDVDEADATVVVSGTASGGGGDVANPADVTLTITDDDAATVTLVLTPATINESGDGNASTVTATLLGPSSAAVTVEVSVPNNAPVTVSNNTTLTIAVGATTSTGTVTLTAVDNAVDGPDATVVVSGTATAPGGDVASPAAVTLTITDDEATPSRASLSVTPASVGEADGATSVTVTATVDGAARTTGTVLTISVTPGTAQAADFEPVEDFPLTIAAEATTGTATFTLTPVDDTLEEPDETLQVTGTSGALSLTPATVVLEDNDDRSIMAITGGTVEEGTAVVFTVTRTGGTENAATVQWATEADTAGTFPATTADYTPVSSARALDFAPGETRKQVAVSTTDDALDEFDETFVVRLSGGSGSVVIAADGAAATGTILDNDAPPELLIGDVTVEEGAVASFPVTLSVVSGKPIRVTWRTVEGTATEEEDYTGQYGQFTIPAGERTVDLIVPTIDDRAVEDPEETYTLRLFESEAVTFGAVPRRGASVQSRLLSGAGSVQLTALGTILDDDRARLRAQFKQVNEALLPWVGSALLRRHLDRITGCLQETGTAGPDVGGMVERAVRYAETQQTAQETGGRQPSLWETLGDTRLAGSLGPADPDSPQRPVTLCAGTHWRRLTNDGPVSWEGALLGANLNGHMQLGESWRVGLDVAHDQGRLDWQLPSVGEAGEWELTLTGVRPYVAWQTPSGVQAWGLVGYSGGTLEVTASDGVQADGIRQRTPVTHRHAAVGGAVPLMTVLGGGFRLRGDAWLGTMEVEDNGELLVGLTAQNLGVRGLVDGTWEYALGASQRLTPAVRLGVQYDDGAGGTGVEVGTDVGWEDLVWGLQGRVTARTLLVDGVVREWGLGGQVRLVAPDGLGPLLDLSTARGNLTDGRAQWWEQGLGGTPLGPATPGMGVELEAGWGLRVPEMAGTLTPYVGVGLVGETSRTLRLGGRLTVASGLAVAVEGTRQERVGSSPEQGVFLQLRRAW